LCSVRALDERLVATATGELSEAKFNVPIKVFEIFIHVRAEK
jgi:hypothetical protein